MNENTTAFVILKCDFNYSLNYHAIPIQTVFAIGRIQSSKYLLRTTLCKAQWKTQLRTESGGRQRPSPQMHQDVLGEEV